MVFPYLNVQRFNPIWSTVLIGVIFCLSVMVSNFQSIYRSSYSDLAIYKSYQSNDLRLGAAMTSCRSKRLPRLELQKEALCCLGAYTTFNPCQLMGWWVGTMMTSRFSSFIYLNTSNYLKLFAILFSMVLLWHRMKN